MRLPDDGSAGPQPTHPPSSQPPPFKRKRADCGRTDKNKVQHVFRDGLNSRGAGADPTATYVQFQSVLSVNEECSCSSCSDNKAPKHTSMIRGEQPVCYWLAERQLLQQVTEHIRWGGITALFYHHHHRHQEELSGFLSTETYWCQTILLSQWIFKGSICFCPFRMIVTMYLLLCSCDYFFFFTTFATGSFFSFFFTPFKIRTS